MLHETIEQVPIDDFNQVSLFTRILAKDSLIYQNPDLQTQTESLHVKRCSSVVYFPIHSLLRIGIAPSLELVYVMES